MILFIAEFPTDGGEGFVCPGHKLCQQCVCPGVQHGGAAAVCHQLGVNKHIQACGLQCRLAQHGGAACIRYRQHAAFGGVLPGQRDALGALFHDLQRHGACTVQCGFQHSGLVRGLLRGVLGQAVGRSQRRKGIGIGLYQCFQLQPQGFSPGVQCLNVRFHDGVLLFAGGQAAHHVAQCHTGSAYQSGSAAAVELGVGRAIGEAMAVMMVSGNVPNMPSLFQSVRFLTTAVASEMSYSGGLQRQALFSIALVLFLFIMLINATLNFFLKRNQEGDK